MLSVAGKNVETKKISVLKSQQSIAEINVLYLHIQTKVLQKAKFDLLSLLKSVFCTYSPQRD